MPEPGFSDRYETVDGSRPEPLHLTEAQARAHPIAAFALLDGGDVFEDLQGRPPPDGPTRARAYLDSHLRWVLHGASAAQQAYVTGEMVRMLSGNRALVGRMRLGVRLRVELLPPGARWGRYGYPPQVSPNALGLFWRQPDWPEARLALRQDALDEEPVLVVHELAHALHALAFTREERAHIDRALQRTWRSRADRDEVFAIYSEREFLPGFTEQHREAPGVYGVARQRWHEEHVFTRFVRHLYFPYKPLAGPRGPRPPALR